MPSAAPIPVLRDDGTRLIDLDPWLVNYAPQLRARFSHYRSALARIDAQGGLLGPISQGHHFFGFNPDEHQGQRGVWYREWAPGARLVTLIGDFNHWDRWNHPLTRDPHGVWSLFIPGDFLKHGSKVKAHVIAADGQEADHIPAYIRRVVQEPGTTNFVGQYWSPPQPYVFRNPQPKLQSGLRIYEAHIGMASEEPRVGSFSEFAQRILPRIRDLGYNAVQLMAIMEHPYYGSFGYHVSNFFAVSSRFGTPEDFKELIDTAHGMGILVLLDIVHSHAVKNINEGLNRFDGTDYQYFHSGPKGDHVAWDSKVFDYAKFEVLRFLLSNDRYWLEEFKIDGFRFDGVTSMIYVDHGLGKAFTSYDDYFGENIDSDALDYLMLANELIHAIKPDAITIAEDVSGMVGMGRPVKEGGIGFDYRLAMGVPDYWIKLLKEKTDEQWDLSELYHTLMNRRFTERHVGYAESHDQALVGDKTLAFRLMDANMYWHMSRGDKNLIVDRGLALHKMIRLITFSLAGEAYLNFMGNEFGHPEWIDFPREGNSWSYQHARRQWSLGDADYLRYRGLKEFDRAMMQLDEKYHLLSDPFIQQLLLHEGDKILAYRRGPLVFIFNFHPTQSFTDYRIPVPDPCDYQLILNTDEARFEGFNTVAGEDVTYWKQEVAMYDRKQSIQVYIPSRSAQVLAPTPR